MWSSNVIYVNIQQTIADHEGKINVQTNKLAEQSDKISKLEHKTTEQVLTIKEQYALQYYYQLALGWL
jgi:hypothetical protein